MFKEVSLYRLKVFCQVANTQSFRIAAEKLNITQPTVSSHIRALEQEMQIPLIERGRISKLTEAGKVFYDYARNVLLQTESVCHIVKELCHGNIGRIIIGATGSLSRYMITDIFEIFKKENPGVELLLYIGNPRQVSQKVLDQEIDFGLIVGDTSLPGVKTEVVANDEIVIVVNPKHSLGRRKKITTEELSKHAFVSITDEFGDHNVVESLLNSYGIRMKEKLMQFEDVECIKRIIKKGNGVAALLGHSVVEDLESGKLLKLNLEGGPLMTNLRMVWLPEKYLSPLHNKFLKCFKKTIRQISRENQTLINKPGLG